MLLLLRFVRKLLLLGCKQHVQQVALYCKLRLPYESSLKQVESAQSLADTVDATMYL